MVPLRGYLGGVSYLKITIKQQPGDIIFCRSGYPEHWVTEITKGERYCNTRFFKGECPESPQPLVKCQVPGCDNESIELVESMYYHARKHSALETKPLPLVLPTSALLADATETEQTTKA